MEKLVYAPTGVAVEVDTDAIDAMLKSGFVKANAKSTTQKTAQTKTPAKRSRTKKASK